MRHRFVLLALVAFCLVGARFVVEDEGHRITVDVNVVDVQRIDAPPPPPPERVDPAPSAFVRPRMDGWRRDGSKLIDKATGKPLVLRGYGDYNLLSDRRQAPLVEIDALFKVIGEPKRSPADLLFRTFSSLPFDKAQWRNGDFIHPRVENWKRRRNLFYQACRDRGIWAQVAWFDEPDRTDRREMPRAENTWFGRRDTFLTAKDLLQKHYLDRIVVGGGTNHLIHEIANEGEARWITRDEMRQIDGWLRAKGWAHRATSWGGGENHEGSTLLWLHWSPRYPANTDGLNRLLRDAVRYREATGNPVGISTDGKGLDDVPLPLMQRLLREALALNLHVEVMLALRSEPMPALHDLPPRYRSYIVGTADAMGLR